MDKYFIYILLCEDNSYYTGITTNINRRLKEHLSLPSGAKYTKSHKPVKLAALWETQSGRSEASKIEHKIKKLKHNDKEYLVKNPQKLTDIIEICSDVENCSVEIEN